MGAPELFLHLQNLWQYTNSEIWYYLTNENQGFEVFLKLISMSFLPNKQYP